MNWYDLLVFLAIGALGIVLGIVFYFNQGEQVFQDQVVEEVSCGENCEEWVALSVVKIDCTKEIERNPKGDIARLICMNWKGERVFPVYARVGDERPCYEASDFMTVTIKKARVE